MAILSVPFTSIYLVEHAAGGAIAHAAGGYLAHSYIPGAVVEAFGVASSVLTQMSSSAGAITSATTSAATNPILLGTVAIAAVAVGTYCYFYGIPAPIEAALMKAGLGTATKQGFMVSLPKLAIALILVGGAGFLAYRFYRSHRAAKMARLIEGSSEVLSAEQAEATVHLIYGDAPWEEFGASLWTSAGDAAAKTKRVARRSLARGASHAKRVALLAGQISAQGSETLAQATRKAGELAGSLSSASASALQLSSDAITRSGSRLGAWIGRAAARLRMRTKPV